STGCRRRPAWRSCPTNRCSATVSSRNRFCQEEEQAERPSPSWHNTHLCSHLGRRPDSEQTAMLPADPVESVPIETHPCTPPTTCRRPWCTPSRLPPRAELPASCSY